MSENMPAAKGEGLINWADFVAAQASNDAPKPEITTIAPPVVPEAAQPEPATAIEAPTVVKVEGETVNTIPTRTAPATPQTEAKSRMERFTDGIRKNGRKAIGGLAVFGTLAFGAGSLGVASAERKDLKNPEAVERIKDKYTLETAETVDQATVLAETHNQDQFRGLVKKVRENIDEYDDMAVSHLDNDMSNMESFTDDMKIADVKEAFLFSVINDEPYLKGAWNALHDRDIKTPIPAGVTKKEMLNYMLDWLEQEDLKAENFDANGPYANGLIRERDHQLDTENANFNGIRSVRLSADGRKVELKVEEEGDDEASDSEEHDGPCINIIMTGPDGKKTKVRVTMPPQEKPTPRTPEEPVTPGPTPEVDETPTSPIKERPVRIPGRDVAKSQDPLSATGVQETTNPQPGVSPPNVARQPQSGEGAQPAPAPPSSETENRPPAQTGPEPAPAPPVVDQEAPRPENDQPAHGTTDSNAVPG